MSSNMIVSATNFLLLALGNEQLVHFMILFSPSFLTVVFEYHVISPEYIFPFVFRQLVLLEELGHISIVSQVTTIIVCFFPGPKA